MFASAMWPIANRKISVEIIHLTFLRQERKNNLNAIWMYLNRRPLVSSGIYCSVLKYVSQSFRFRHIAYFFREFHYFRFLRQKIKPKQYILQFVERIFSWFIFTLKKNEIPNLLYQGSGILLIVV